jgi:hypothetical protein
MTTLNVSKKNAMKKIAFLFLTALLVKTNFAQYKNDNLLYKTVYTTDLCKELNNSPGYLLLDVRYAR